MFKFYSLTAEAFTTQIANAKMPLQQKQLYAALVRLGKPSRGVDIVAEAKRAGLITKQDEAVLAAWYFSVKRRPACITCSSEQVNVSIDDLPEYGEGRGGEPTKPRGPSKPVYAE